MNTLASFKNVLLAGGIILLVVPACTQNDPGPAPVGDRYEQDVLDWRNDRINRLKEPTGWMRLAGLYWLEEGAQTFGSAPDNDLVFPVGHIPDYAGSIRMEQGKVFMTVNDGVSVTADGEPVRQVQIFGDDAAPVLRHGTLEWLVIQRGDLYGIRLYNSANELVDRFDGFPHYPIDPKWHLNARFIPNTTGKTIRVANILGQIELLHSPGTLEFYIDGNRFTLDALEGGERLFLIVGDASNKSETYQAGRYMYIDYPAEGHALTIIDFNTLYNPPCSYSPFSTCQLPPPQNVLDIALTAGERRPVPPYNAGFSK